MTSEINSKNKIECWDYKKTTDGRNSKVCLACLYYASRHNGRSNDSVKCWDYLKCPQNCAYRQKLPVTSKPCSNCTNKPIAPNKKVALLRSKSKLLSTVQKLKTLDEQKNINVKDVKDLNKNKTSPNVYKAIAATLKVLLKERK